MIITQAWANRHVNKSLQIIFWRSSAARQARSRVLRLSRLGSRALRPELFVGGEGREGGGGGCYSNFQNWKKNSKRILEETDGQTRRQKEGHFLKLQGGSCRKIMSKVDGQQWDSNPCPHRGPFTKFLKKYLTCIWANSPDNFFKGSTTVLWLKSTKSSVL